MDVAILAGGLGTRIAPATRTAPKALVEINGEPFIAHQLRLLRAQGIQRVVLCVGYLGEMIRDYTGDGSAFGLTVEYCFDGPRLRGTAGAIAQALPMLGDEFFVVYGDSYLNCDYSTVAEAFRRSGKLGLMTVFRNDGQWDRSNVEFVDGQILAYDKVRVTPRMRHIDYGLGVFRRDAFADASTNETYDLAALYQALLDSGELAACEIQERFYEVGSFVGIQEFSVFLNKRAT